MKKILFFLLCIYTLEAQTEQVQNQNNQAQTTITTIRTKKDWNLIMYMVNNNNLHKYGVRNFKQMTKMGSNKNINLMIQIDELGSTESKRYYIEKNNPREIDQDTFVGSTTSGTGDNFFEFVKWAIKNYPAQRQAIILWNHGTGIKDPSMWGRVIMKCRDDFYFHNKETGLLELNRHALDRVRDRGIGFNDETQQYINNQELKNTLEKICKTLLKNSKIDLLCMDACHMGMIEIGSQVSETADYMVASQEVEPGSGYNYEMVLAPFTNGSMSPDDFARHIVSCYEKEYKSSLSDYTQSAVNLGKISRLEESVNEIAITMLSLLKTLPSFVRTVRDIRRNTTTFFDTDYIDLHHFYTKLLDFCNHQLERSKDLKASYQPEVISSRATELVEMLAEQLREGINGLEVAIIENVSGRSLPNARGLSIYFPQRTVHGSYAKTVFAKITKWPAFIKEYLKQA